MNAAERETVVIATDADSVVTVWTAQRQVITKLRKEPLFTEVKSGIHEKTEWAEFTIPSELWSPVGVIRKRGKMTPEQAEKARERLKRIKEK